ncbi:Zinc metalloproteinase nas-34 [Trichinella nativa]|uniref:Metalloendopeptidase n=1 Tax=Trichinella nativa TaxID=6335 RepID=A0A0V1L6P1_9BILA|nr:Zinc metalloproteinase nas-34 [Trichinella nativa]
MIQLKQIITIVFIMEVIFVIGRTNHLSKMASVKLNVIYLMMFLFFNGYKSKHSLRSLQYKNNATMFSTSELFRIELQSQAGFNETTANAYFRFMENVRNATLQTNPEENSNLFEGDILLTVEQMKVMEKKIFKNSSDADTLRGMVTGNAFSRWKRTIPYSINTRSGVDTNAVERGIKQWEKITCLKFIRQDNHPTGDYMEFFKGSGCYSYVGKIGGKQPISIGTGCESVGIVCHEIGHALGVWHEQNRPDRDKFINVHHGNIKPYARSNFYRLTNNIALVNVIPFDYGSQMLYGPRAFAININKNTISALDVNYRSTLGQRDFPSFYDAKTINLIYCNGTAHSIYNLCKPLECEFDGYADPKNCSTCRCPVGLAGPYCKEAQTTNDDCGKINIEIETTPWTINKSGQGKCHWLFKTAPDSRIELQLVNLKFPCKITCSRSFISVQYGNSMANSPARFCCYERNAIIVSKSNHMLISYYGTSTDFVTFIVKKRMQSCNIYIYLSFRNGILSNRE